MKISTSLDHGVSAGLTYTRSALAMKQAGYEGIDLSLCRYQDTPAKLCTDEWTQDVFAQAEAAKAAGLELAQCHLPYYPGHIENPGDGSTQAYIDYMMPMYLHAMKAAGAVGCRTCVIHTVYMKEGYEATVRANAEVIKEMLPSAEENNLEIAIENVFVRRDGEYKSAYVEKAETIMDIIDKCGSDRVGVCLDTGHANIFRFNISDMARTFGSRLIALHVNSNAGHDEHAVPYSVAGWCERINFEEFTRTLREIGYKGWYNLEITGGRFPAEVAPAFYAYTAGMARYLSQVR